MSWKPKKENVLRKRESVVSDAARSLSAISTKLCLLDFAIKSLVVGTVAFELEAKARSDFRKLRNGRYDDRKKEERRRRGEWKEPKEGDGRILSMIEG